MTQFEQMLLDKGYIKHIFNSKTMKFETAKGHKDGAQNIDWGNFVKGKF